MATHTNSIYLQNEIIQQVTGESVKNTKNNSKTAENFSLGAVIGVINVKRWNQLKASFSCETNETFATKLLDLAQKYLNRYCKDYEDDNQNRDNESTSLRNNKRRKGEMKRNKKQKFEKQTETIIHERQNSPASIKIENLQSSSFHQDFDDAISIKQENDEASSASIKLESKDEKIEKDFKINFSHIDIKTKNMEMKQNCDISEAPYAETKHETEPSSVQNQHDSTQRLCQSCNTHHVQDCPLTYPSLIIADAIDLKSWQTKHKNLCTESEDDKYTFAKMSLPNLLDLRPTLTDHGLGVFAKIDVQEFSQFGPLIGKVTKAVDILEDSTMRNIWEICGESQNVYFNTEDLEASNWMRFVRPAPVREDRNLTVIARESFIFFVTIRTIKAEEELLYWYDSNVVSIKKKADKTYCGSCYRNFSHPLYYATHCSVFHDTRLSVRKYHCKVCGAVVVGKKNIRKHAAELHNGEGAFQCQFCKKYFLTLNNLEVHRNYGCSSNPHKSKLLCDLCGRKFSQPQRLRGHIKSMHSDSAEVLEFQCKQCLKILSSKPTLQRHIKEVHEKQSDSACSCSRCGRFFQNKCNLKIHMLTHSGVKPFRCEVDNCNSAFTTKQWLLVHYKKVHKLSAAQIPKIERKVEFTLEAYSGVEEEKNKKMEQNYSKQSNFSAVKLEEDSEEDETISIDSKFLCDPYMAESPLPEPSEEKNIDVEQKNYSKQFDANAVKLEADSEEEGTIS